VGRLQDGDTLQHATQTSMDILRHWIDLNKDNKDKNRGIPVERHLSDLTNN
jgi:pyridoxine kinase